MCVPGSRTSRLKLWLTGIALLGVAAALRLGRPWLASITAGASLMSVLLCLMPCLIPLALRRCRNERGSGGAAGTGAT